MHHSGVVFVELFQHWRNSGTGKVLGMKAIDHPNWLAYLKSLLEHFCKNLLVEVKTSEMFLCGFQLRRCNLVARHNEVVLSEGAKSKNGTRIVQKHLTCNQHSNNNLS